MYLSNDRFLTCPQNCPFLVREGKQVGFCKRYQIVLQGNASYPYAWRVGKCVYDEGICPNCGRKGTYKRVETCTFHAHTRACSACGWRQCFDVPPRLPEPKYV